MKHLKTVARITFRVIGIVLGIFTVIVVYHWVSRKLEFDVLYSILTTLAGGALYLADKLCADRKIADPKKALFDDAEGERRYLNLVLKDFEERRGVLEFVTLSGKTEETIPFFDEWGYSELLDKGKVSSPSSQDKIPLRNIEEALDRHLHFVLIGSPGAGKTTTLRYIARKYAIARLDNTFFSPLPLLLYLPQWQNKTSITEFIRSNWPFSTDIMGLLKVGDVILFLDGLNEIGANGAQKADLLSTWLSSMDAPKRVIITCRSDDYLDPSQHLKLQNIPVVSVDDLNKEQIEKFAQNYLGDKADTFLSRLGKTMKVHERVSDDEKNAHSLSVLARNPYFLSALIYLFQDSSETDLPYNVGTLFQRLSSALWAREQKRSPQRLPEFSDVERAFGRLAFSMIDEETPFDVSQAYALKKMFPGRLRFGMHNERAKQILQVGEHCNFILISGDQVRFYHQLIQEYFASLELKYQRTLKELPKPQQDSLAGPYGLYGTRSSYKWDEVIVSLAGITTKNVDDFVKTLVNYDPYLVAKVIASGVQVSHGVREAVMPEIIKYDGPYYAVGVSARILAEIGESTAIPHVVKLLSHHNFMRVGIGAIDALRIYGSQAVPALIEELKSSSSYVRANCVYVLGEIGDARAVPHLIGLLSDREHGVYGTDMRVCDAVARALLSIATPEAKTAVLTWQRDLITTILSQGKDVDDDALRSIDALIAVKDHKTHFALLELFNDNFHLILVQIIHHLIQVIQDEPNQEYKEISRLNARVRVLASIIVKLSNPISLHSLELLSDYKYFEVRDALTYSETPEAKAFLEIIENKPKG